MRALVLSVLFSVLIVSAATASAPCASRYETAIGAVRESHVGKGLEQKLLTKVGSAWRKFQSGRKNGTKNASQEIAKALLMLNKDATKQLPAAVRDSIRDELKSFRDCMDGDQTGTSTVTIHVVRPTLGSPDRAPAAGAIVRINGEEIGVTGADGTLTVEVREGANAVEAIVYPLERAVGLAPAGATDVHLLLTDGESRENTVLQLDEAPDGVLAANASTFTARFVDDTGTTIPLAVVEDVQLRGAGDRSSTYHADAFVIRPDGSMAPQILALWKTAISRDVQQELAITATDARGRQHSGTLKFTLANGSCADSSSRHHPTLHSLLAEYSSLRKCSTATLCFASFLKATARSRCHCCREETSRSRRIPPKATRTTTETHSRPLQRTLG